jgi:Fic family protein
MLIPLFLYEKKLLSRPVFYLSAYLERHRKEYEDGLHALTFPDHWNSWIDFFLQAMIEQAEENSNKARQILELYDELKKKALELTHSQFAVPLLDRLFKDPIFRSSSLVGQAGMPSKQRIMQILGKLKSSGILKVAREGSGRRPQTLVLKALLKICEGKKPL